MQLISLFSGAGGLDLGFEKAGFETIFAADYFEAAVNSYNLNSKRPVARVADLSQITLAQLIDGVEESMPGAAPRGVIGGPPCQGFSRGNAGRNDSDPRNRLAVRYAYLVNGLADYFGIDFFVFENVPEIRAKKNANFLHGLREQLSENFDIFEKELNAHDFGVPQTRKRFFIVGINKKHECKEFEFPVGVKGSGGTIVNAIYGLPEPTYFKRGLRQGEIPFHPNHWTMMPKSPRFGGEMPIGGRSFIKLDWAKPSRTVAYGNREIHVHPNGSRRLSIYEAMLLQGFPKKFQLAGYLSEQVTQVSNAVPPPVAFAIAEQISALLATLVPAAEQKAISARRNKNGIARSEKSAQNTKRK